MGDQYIYLVDKETWDWIHSPEPDWSKLKGARPEHAHHAGYELVGIPVSVRARLEKLHVKERDYRDKSPFPGVFLSKTDYVNTRALNAPKAIVGGKESPQFSSLSEVMKYIKKHGIKVVGEYQGEIC